MKSEQENIKPRYGDYQTLAVMLDAPSTDAARMRYRRNDPEAIKAMEVIFENREKLINKFKNK